ncbi:methionine synthase [Halostreptopolyspora alba]|uniref:Methionine synthase n=1 Tax=Halostreptopolyspora alba TaxID=2487137 RepID=A0A3N0EAM1_9ACTN|nr:methionine synthase [Nocardiopsaceae bacterium YIM 96095]
MSEQHSYPWPEASYTGVGSHPGEDPDEAQQTILGEFPELPHLVELPDRGAGADMVGRAAALLVDFPVEVQPTGWRVVQRPGRDLARATSFLNYDLDALEKHANAYEGPLKIQVAGPWTLAAGIELRSGEKLVADAGAVADLCESLVEGVRTHIDDIRRRVPMARVLVQLDEPSLPAVLRGTVPTASGYQTLRAVDRVVCEERLRAMFGAVEEADAFPMAHCCSPDVPVDLLRRSGARALSLDATRLGRADDEDLGVAVEDGVGLFLGVVAGAGMPLSDPATTVDPVRELWNRLGFRPEGLPRTVVTTPVCGLAGAAPEHARAVMRTCRESARVLRDEPRR